MAKENKSPVSKKVEDIKPEDKRKALETALTQIKKPVSYTHLTLPTTTSV